MQILLTLFWCYFGQVSSSALGSPFRVELNSNAMYAYFPIKEVAAILEVAENRNGDMQTWYLVAGDGAESRVFEGAVKNEV